MAEERVIEGGEDEFIFNEYAIDDSLSPLQRLTTYCRSDFSLQRLVLVRELGDTAAHAGFVDTVNTILPLLTQFASDTEPSVRHAFAGQLPTLADYLVESGGDKGYNELLNALLPHAVELLLDKNVEVGAAAMASFVKLAQRVKPEHIEKQLYQTVKTLAKNDGTEDYRLVAAQLFDELAPKFGKQLVETHVMPEVKALSQDASMHVRRTTGNYLGGLASVLGPEKAVTLVLPIYQQLCRDDVWAVRKSCAESIVKMSQALPETTRAQQVTPLFRMLSEDSIRWVRVAAYQNLGPLIHTLRSSDVTTMFLKVFTDMAFQSGGNGGGGGATGGGGENDFAEYCAFSLPAVVQVMGPARWHELDDAFATLLRDVQWKVRRSLSHSLHEIAKILGPELSEKYLVNALEFFLKDLDEVKFGVLANVDKFLEVLPTAQRERLTPLICAVPVESENWRLRNLVATKLGPIAVLLPPRCVHDNISDLLVRLLDDAVTDVRTSCYFSVGLVLQHLEATCQTPALRELYTGFARTIIGLASNEHFQHRQMFVYIWQQVLERGCADVADLMFESATQLANDRVSNVRYSLARVVAHSVLPNPKWATHPKLISIVQRLQSDGDVDVAAKAQKILARPPDLSTAAFYRTAL